MINVIFAELSKMRTARSSLVMILTAVGIALASGLLGSLAGDYSDGRSAGADLISSGGFFAAIFTLIIGVLAITGEMRHGSIAPSLLVTPVRERLIAAKLAAVLLVCAAIGTLSVGGCLAIGAVLGPGQGFELGLSGGEVARAIGTGALVAALFGAIGLGVGALIRNQAGAIVAVLVWLFAIDPLLVALVSGLEPYSLTAAIDPAIGAGSASDAAHSISQIHGLLLIAGYGLVLFGAGTALFRRVEITG